METRRFGKVRRGVFHPLLPRLWAAGHAAGTHIHRADTGSAGDAAGMSGAVVHGSARLHILAGAGVVAVAGGAFGGGGHGRLLHAGNLVFPALMHQRPQHRDDRYHGHRKAAQKIKDGIHHATPPPFAMVCTGKARSAIFASCLHTVLPAHTSP